MDFIDFFCGIGTIRMGMEQAGHKCVYSVEWDKHKRRIYGIIFGEEPEGQDIRECRENELPRADCWCFGAPCQDFSIAGNRAGLEGDRSSLVREVFRLVRETKEEYRPKYLFYENVKGMFSSNKGLDYFQILCEMDELGYDIEWQLLNSKDFGVPQNRERVFTIGHLRGRSTGKVFPIGGENQNLDIKVIGDLNMPGRHESAQRIYDPNYIGPALNTCGGGGLETKIIVRPCLTPDRLEKRQNGRRFKEPGEPMFTLTKQDIYGVLISKTIRVGGRGSPYGSKQNWDTYRIGDRIRRLTPRECMRLQGVSDEITDKLIEAGISDTQMYRGAGDATTVNVIYEIAKRMS